MTKYKSSPTQRLIKKGLIKPPQWVGGGLQYETMMGSVAYGVSSDTSDIDVYGFCMPPKDYVFPHLAGHILGFSKQVQGFNQYQEHHIKEKDRDKVYDLAIFSIVKYFRLCMDNNPNMIDSLFTPATCVLLSTPIGEMVRSERRKFLHRGSWHKFKGYAYSQMHKMRIKEPDPKSKRYDSVIKHGYDLKFAYHVVRLLSEVEQILVEGDIDLMRNREQLKSIRRGDWKLAEVEEYFNTKEKDLEKIYLESKLQKYPDEKVIKQLLVDCMEQYYGNLEKAIITRDKATDIVKKIKQMVQDY